MRKGQRQQRRWLSPIVVVLVVSVGVIAYETSRPKISTWKYPCYAAAGDQNFGFDQEQATNATTIAAVGIDLGLPDHAVTIALATALQESYLHNLSYGDLDSVGLFQQRPSQGWGTNAQLQDPVYAAGAFYKQLRKVKGWETMPTTEAAQAVQRSAAPNAYEQWDAPARVLAQALTGEVAAGFACQVTGPHSPGTAATTEAAINSVFGPTDLSSLTTQKGWLVSSWVISRAHDYGVASLTFQGKRWTARTGVWSADPNTAAENKLVLTF